MYVFGTIWEPNIDESDSRTTTTLLDEIKRYPLLRGLRLLCLTAASFYPRLARFFFFMRVDVANLTRLSAKKALI